MLQWRMPFPQVTVAPSATQRLRNFDCWVFRDEIQRQPPSATENGETVEQLDGHGAFLGYAWYSSTSHIAARLVSTDRQQPPDRSWLAQRLTHAIARRASLSGTNAKRLVFSEADGIPGLIVDQYGDYLVLQIRTAGAERLKTEASDLLRRQLRPKSILERSDKEFREEEGLPPVARIVHGVVPERIEILEDELKFFVDPHRGHKTGFYLDQRDTRRLLRTMIRPDDRLLDVCAYTGAFGIGAAVLGARVTCVEQDEANVALARENAALNKVGDRIDWVTGDAFYWLEAKAKEALRYDWVLLDPPALAKSKAEIPKARRALHQLLVPALQLLADDGTLVLSLCTYHLLQLGEELLRMAAADARRRLQIRAVSLQATDHPWILQMPMTRYLMSWFAQSCEPPTA